MSKAIIEMKIPVATIVSFDVTGIDRDGKRFKDNYISLDHALCINLWNGSVWSVLNTGKRVLIKRVKNG